MHEYVHLWQQNYGQHPVAHNYQNREFVERCEAVGLHPATGYGAHNRPADGLFAEFLRAYGVPEPKPLSEPRVTPKGRPLDWWTDPGKRKRGRSSLRKWTCGCQNVRVGTKEFHAQCLLCGNAFQLLDEQQKAATDNASTKTVTVATVDSGRRQEELDFDFQMSHDPLDPDDVSPAAPWGAPGP